jgi:hypothetical protein
MNSFLSTAIVSGICLCGSVDAVSLPSFQMDASRSLSQRAGLEAADKWWVQVGDRVYHAPDEASPLSADIKNYYYAVGSEEGLSDALRSTRVGGEGHWHIFELPEGSSLLQTDEASSYRSGSRRSSVSRLSPLVGGKTLSKGFAQYKIEDSYQNPLSKAGQEQEKLAVSKVTRDAYQGYLESLVNLGTRSYSSQSASHKAVAMLHDEFKALGYTVCEHEFESADGDKMVNLLAYEPGAGSQAVVVGAHYDSRPFDGPAPGAVDNGSGVAGLLAMAKALKDSKVNTNKPVIFAAFAGEEAGLFGSKAFANELKNGGQAIPKACIPKASSFLEIASKPHTSMTTGAIIMDEIGWVAKTSMYDGVPTVNLESDDWASEVMQHLKASNDVHNGNKLNVVHSNKPFGSDHCSFLDLGMKSVLTIQGDDESYPDYHKSSDKIQNVDEDYATKIVRMNMGALLRMAGVQTGQLQGL